MCSFCFLNIGIEKNNLKGIKESKNERELKIFIDDIKLLMFYLYLNFNLLKICYLIKSKFKQNLIPLHAFYSLV